ncbi:MULTISPECIES: heme exporter protein CcmB [Chitinophaga]|uniref:heme exporter protein CcmB n=1 Tax=Chitinophaga TaxID=79328 RepID=UPI0009D259F6|nr:MULTISPECIES: heme exporter protein CcmB [Chitinophaga]OMP80662.1 cytochrome C biogenesis protein [[Flexibacter] sp. ATCC 35208]WPQ64967.1 heme exporter protein CcmB [Chitinophaga sancti]WPV69426.1 heme exporter protein CcmB [Chitinophaga sp. LS1]
MKSTAFQQTITLVKKDILLELRQKYALYGVLLYIISTVFVINLMIGKPEEKTWNALFWVVQLFVSVNAIAKSFLQENRGRLLYFYSLVHPRNFIIAKLIYNILLMALMSIITLVCCILFMGNPIINISYFLGVIMLGGLSLSLLFTMLAAIAAQANQNAALMAIMGFPIMLPLLTMLSNIARSSFITVYQPGLPKMFLMLGAMDILIVGLSLILFPFLWKD